MVDLNYECSCVKYYSWRRVLTTVLSLQVLKILREKNHKIPPTCGKPSPSELYQAHLEPITGYEKIYWPFRSFRDKYFVPEGESYFLLGKVALYYTLSNSKAPVTYPVQLSDSCRAEAKIWLREY